MSEKYIKYAEYAKKMGVVDVELGVDGERYVLSEGFKRELLLVIYGLEEGGMYSVISKFPWDEIERAVILMALVRHCGVAIDPEVCCVALFVESIIVGTIDREFRLIGGDLR